MEKTLILRIPEGFEVDLDRSNLSKGLIYYKEVKNRLSKTWEEAYNKLNYAWCLNDSSEVEDIPRQYFTNPTVDKKLVASEKQAEAILALTQLLVLRDEYRNSYKQGWKPDWNNNNNKYSIDEKYNELSNTTYINYFSLFTFPTEELAKLFLTNFKDLLGIYFEGIN